MRIADRVILTLYTFCLAIASIVIILFPFEELKIFSLASIEPFLLNIKGNYWFSLIGLAFLIVSIRFLISGLTVKQKNMYIVRYTNMGELKISSSTIEGIAHNAASGFEGIKEIKTGVDLRDEKVVIKIKGIIEPEVNIPEITTNIQNKVKEDIEKTTGLEVNEVKVEINNITTSVKKVR